MSEPTNQQESGKQAQRPPEERAGDLLRKERITRRIAVETIARDLKLNAKYIKALEASDYQALPADPYVRVYIRSIAKYLMLDPEEILKRFYTERGIFRPTEEQERSTKINISMTRRERSRAPWVAIAILLVVLGGGAYLALRFGLLTPSVSSESPLSDTTETIEDEEFLQGVPLDTALGEGAEAEEETVESGETTEEDGEEKLQSAAPPKERMRLVIRALRDSVWLQVFADGKSWRNFLHPERARVFTALDSFNLHVGSNANLQYLLDGRRVRGVEGGGVAVFKLDSSGVEMWTLDKWQSVFKDRLKAQ